MRSTSPGTGPPSPVAPRSSPSPSPSPSESSLADPAIPLPLASPRPPESVQPYSFPLVASIAPVIGSVLIWALTKSSFALVFAFLGPIVAVASLADARINGKRKRRREHERFDREHRIALAAIDRSHDRDRDTLIVASPGVSGIDRSPPNDPARWLSDPAEGVPVRLGLFTAESALRIEGLPTTAPLEPDRVGDELENLRRRAGTIDGVPFVVDARRGIGVVGPDALCSAALRGFALQVANLLSPADAQLEVVCGDAGGRPRPETAGDDEWIEALPHDSRSSAAQDDGVPAVFRWRVGAGQVVMAGAPTVESLPQECRVVLRLGRGGAIATTDDRQPQTALGHTVELISIEQARVLADALGVAAVTLGKVPPSRAEAWPTTFAALGLRPRGSPAEQPRTASLSCSFAWSAEGAFAVDLVSDGPHAVIGGMTGSGKSEFLVSWVLAMATVYDPATVTFLLVDFKGGSSFAAIERLPHVVGVVTDLDVRSAERALVSLRAELRYRERVIAEAGARSIDDPRVTMPRLVIVVDEFAAMASDFPQLHDLFTDLAGRGRSLGLHLILCTQRPAGVIRDGVLANAAIRASLRVNNRADSVAVIGTGEAAELPGDQPGRALISLGGEPPRLVAVLRPSRSDIAAIEQRAVGGTVRRPWRDELGREIALADLELERDPELDAALDPRRTPSRIPFGRLDLPELQRQDTAYFEPAADGNLIVIGAAGSGKSELLSTLLAAPNVERVAFSVEGAWDIASAALDGARQARPDRRLLVFDDLDALVDRFPEDHRAAFLDLLAALLREGSAVGLVIAMSVRRLSPGFAALAVLCESRIILHLPTRQDHLIVGGAVGGYSSQAPPGSGEWNGVRLQVARASASHRVIEAATTGSVDLDLTGRATLAVVSVRPDDFGRRLRASGVAYAEVVDLSAAHRPSDRVIGDAAASGSRPAVTTVDARAATVIIGDPDAWQANWTMLTGTRSRSGVLFDGCSVPDFRAISGRRALPPPLDPARGDYWLLEPDGTVVRVAALSSASS